MTPWPQFDSAGSEVVGTVTKSLVSVVGGSAGQAKRCVYRGRGAPCHNDLSSLTATFNGTSNEGLLGCSPNNSCLVTTKTGFNDRIARFASSALAQNIAQVTTPGTDTVGLGARIIGRPFDYYGSQSPPASALTALNTNNLKALCVPGKDIKNATSNYQLNSLVPTTRTGSSDKILGIGMGLNISSASFDEKFLSACPATDDIGAALHIGNKSLSDDNIEKYTRTQNLSTALLDLTPLSTTGIFSENGTDPVTKIGYHPNACLKSAGSTCFSDLDCGPSSFIATRVAGVDVSTVMNEAEELFWEEGLVCGNPEIKTLDANFLNPNFDNKQNRCCRETGNTITVYSGKDGESFDWCTGTSPALAGVNLALNSTTRYSRVHTGYDKMTCDPSSASSTTPFALSIKASSDEDRYKQIKYQFKTLDTINSRTCCTKHWARSFHSENGGGHAFSKQKSQTYNLEMFKNINWMPQDTSLGTITGDAAFVCSDDGINHATSACEIRTFTDDEAKKYLEFAGSLELLGIPQVAIKSNDEIFKIVGDTQTAASSTYNSTLPLDNTIVDITDVNADFKEGTTRLYSAANEDAFDFTTLKKIFSEEEFNCCLPTGQIIPNTIIPGQCCTGFIANNDPKEVRCCLPDFADVTVYYNRYVSSEGRGLPDSAYNPDTGYIDDPGMVQQLAAQNLVCCSKTTTTGFVLSELSIPVGTDGAEFLAPDANDLTTSRRFLYRDDDVDNNGETGFKRDLFNAGLKFNNHVYCIPKDLAGQLD